ncbi:polymeric immunoglobulin receptor-like [Pygocentrus nattereri]|uniref:polymeric immunoglobulin receptor-like n=1 Tax=Pygocentrus nattereri TaxID=42514 RepID=UPI001891E043|nr:polymeric immunoglobulin receptor-like [Pygocentrus nattereri]
MGTPEANVQTRMKILLIFTLYLFSGPVYCFDVIGYAGGSIIMTCRHLEVGSKFVCKGKPSSQCEIMVHTQTQKSNKWVQQNRLYLYEESRKEFTVLYRNLSSQDAGSYQCGETGVWSNEMNLIVNSDPCCTGPRIITADVGETASISCPFPKMFETNTKYFYKMNGPDYTQLIDTTKTQRDRFSISEDRSAAVLSVRISDVSEDDGGVYFCAVQVQGDSVRYYSLYTEIQLQVTESSVNIILIITVCVCVALLLIGGSTQIYYKLRDSKHKLLYMDINIVHTCHSKTL